MYQISDQQIDYILSDISARGVEMESLQQNLLDHVCCIIENNLEANGDFENFYQKTIQTFYKDELWEIEEETLLLLTYKNYYTMKKIMINSGLFSAAAMIFGILFKFMYWPGASALIILGIGTSSLLFLPLLFALKIKDKHQTKDKLILAVGTLAGILLSLHILFKVMHWPYAIELGGIGIGLLAIVFLPIYFFSGIKNPENKVNTIAIAVTTIMACGLWLTLLVSPKGMERQLVKNTCNLLINQQILENERTLFIKKAKNDSTKSVTQDLANQILKMCGQLTSSIIIEESVSPIISIDFETDGRIIKPKNFDDNQLAKIDTLAKQIDSYNLLIASSKTKHKIPNIKNLASSVSDGPAYDIHNRLIQIQLMVLQNEQLED